jgi:hypothetical protein
MPIFLTPNASGFAQGRYAVQSDLETQFGTSNIATWSNLNASGVQPLLPNVARIQQAFDYADARIISTFLNFGNYATPLVPQGTDVFLVNRWNVIITGAWLYQARGIRDADPQGDHIANLLKAVDQEMLTYRATNKLNAVRRWPTSAAPVGV